MKYFTLLVVMISFFSCSQDNQSKRLADSNELLNTERIVLAHDTVFIDKGDTVVNHIGDSIKGKIEIGNPYHKWVINYENGWRVSMKLFTSDSSLSTYSEMGQGKLNGTHKEWYDDGTLKLKGFYTNGKADSTWSYYYQNGSLDTRGNYNPEVQIEEFEQERTIEDMEYGHNRILVTSYSTHSVPDGVWEFHSSNGRLLKKIEFDKGKIKRLYFGDPE